MIGKPQRVAWPAFPGPVFRRELGSAARSGWIYLARALASATLAVYVASSVRLGESLTIPGILTLEKIAELAERTFDLFISAQYAVILAMVPLLVAGSIAEEKARGTLGLLLAGRLSSAEIVADKLAARMLTVGVMLLAGVPVLALIGLLGGIDPARLGLCYLGTATSAWFAASLSILVSAHARSAGGAIVGAYAAMLGWIAAPPWLVVSLDRPGLPASAGRILPVARELARSSPLSLRAPREAWGPWATAPGGWEWMMGEMSSLQAVGGLALFALAAWRLRPSYRAQVGADPARRRGRVGRWLGLRGASKPPCGDDPIAWKERYAPESAWMSRLVLLVSLALIVHSTVNNAIYNVGALYLTHHREKYYALEEMFVHGLDLGPWGADGAQRAGLNYQLCESAALLYFAALVAVAILAASGVAGERARGTWEGLLSTPLDRRAIVRAKIWGAIRAVRPLLGLAGFFYLTSMAATAMHPVGFVLGVAMVASFVWIAAAAGTYASARSKDANRAIGRTALILAAVELVPAAILFPIAGGAAALVTSPMLAMTMPISRMHFQGLSRVIRVEPSAIAAIVIAPGAVLGRAIGAWLLTRAALRRVERERG